MIAWLVRRGHPLTEVLGLTLAEVRVLAAGHAAVDATEGQAQMGRIRAAVWADADEFGRLAGGGGRDGPDNRADWLEGWSGPDGAEAGTGRRGDG